MVGKTLKRPSDHGGMKARQSQRNELGRKSIITTGKTSEVWRTSVLDGGIEEEDFFSGEIDVDSRVMRYSRKHLNVISQPLTESTENSRIVDVLQSVFPVNLPDDLNLPDFNAMKPNECMEYLGDKIGCDNHEENLASFWILDVLAEILREGQLNSVTNENLKVICSWFGHLLKMLAVKALTRDEFFNYFNEMLTIAECDYINNGKIPNTRDVIINMDLKRAEREHIQQVSTFYEESQSDTHAQFVEKSVMELIENYFKNSDQTNLYRTESSVEGLYSVHFDLHNNDSASDGVKKTTSCSKLNELEFLTRQIFGVFANRFKFEVIRSVFSSPPEIIPVVVVENMKFPKDVGVPEKVPEDTNLKYEELPKNGKQQGKKTSITKKGKGEKIKEPTISEALERFKSEMEELDKKRESEVLREQTKFDSIKPLVDSVDEEYFERRFPARSKSLQIKPEPEKKKKK